MHLFLLLFALLAVGCTSADPSSPAPASSSEKLLGAAPGPQAIFYTAGTSGAYTVPAGAFVSGITAHATGSGAYLTISVQAVGQADAGTGSQIPIPPGVGFEIGRPVLTGSVLELGPGTVVTTSGTDSYAIFMVQAR